MREIQVSTDTFAALWALRQPGEETENDILERLLGVGSLKEPRGFKREVRESFGKRRWVDDIVLAFENLGGGGYYSEIYREVRAIRIASGGSVPRTFEEVVRKEIETHSSDSDAYSGREDYFCAPKGKGAGFWQLRKSGSAL